MVLEVLQVQGDLSALPTTAGVQGKAPLSNPPLCLGRRGRVGGLGFGDTELKGGFVSYRDVSEHLADEG